MLVIYLLNISEQIDKTVYQKALEKSVTFILYPSIQPSFRSLIFASFRSTLSLETHTCDLLEKEELSFLMNFHGDYMVNTGSGSLPE